MTNIVHTRVDDLPDFPPAIAFPTSSASHGADEPPRPLYRAETKAEPYPVDDLGPVLAPVARAIAETTQAQEAICANAVLAAASLAVQAHADVKLPTGQVKPTSLFILTIAASGERKTTADGYALEGVRERERELRELSKAEMLEYRNRSEVYDKARADTLNKAKDADAQMAALTSLGESPAKPDKPILVCSEPTSEGLVKLMAECPPTLGLFSSEGGSFIGGHAMSDEAKLRTGARLNNIWDGTPIDRVRAGDGSSVIAGKRVALHLMAQPEAAGRFLGDATLRDLGLHGRFLMSAPPPRAGTRYWREPSFENLAIISQFAGHVATLLRTIPPACDDGRLRTVAMSEEARLVFVAGYNSTEAEMAADGKLSIIKPFASKMAEHAARIAAVLTLVANPNATAIAAEAMKAGFHLANHYAAEALRLADEVLVSEQLRVAEKLRKWLTQRGRELVYLAEIYQFGPAEIRDANSAKAAMRILEQHGVAVPLETAVIIDGRKRSQAWRITLAGAVISGEAAE